MRVFKRKVVSVEEKCSQTPFGACDKIRSYRFVDAKKYLLTLSVCERETLFLAVK